VLTPPARQGLHFVYHSAGHDARSGEFVHVAGGEVLVRRWDEAVETFAPGCGMSGARSVAQHAAAPAAWAYARRRLTQRGAAAEEAEAAVATVRAGHYDAGLGPYPPGGVAAQWRQLCGHVTSRTLARAGVPVGTRVVPGDAEETAAPGAPQDQLAPFFEGVARAPRFSPVAARRLTGMTAAEVMRVLRVCGALLVLTHGACTVHAGDHVQPEPGRAPRAALGGGVRRPAG
jgi:hypothetical protein